MFADFGIVVRRGSEIIEELYAGIPIIKVKVLAPAPPPPKPSAPKEEADEDGESKAWYERAWDWLKGAVGAIGAAVNKVVDAVLGTVAGVIGGAVGFVGGLFTGDPIGGAKRGYKAGKAWYDRNARTVKLVLGIIGLIAVGWLGLTGIGGAIASVLAAANHATTLLINTCNALVFSSPFVFSLTLFANNIVTWYNSITGKTVKRVGEPAVNWFYKIIEDIDDSGTGTSTLPNWPSQQPINPFVPDWQKPKG